MHKREFRYWGMMLALLVLMGGAVIFSMASEKPRLRSIQWTNEFTNDYRVRVERITWETDNDQAVLLGTMKIDGNQHYILNFSGFDDRDMRFPLPEKRVTLVPFLEYRDHSVLMQPMDTGVKIVKDPKAQNVAVIFRAEDYREKWRQAMAAKENEEALATINEAERLQVDLPEMGKDKLDCLYYFGYQRFREEDYVTAEACLRKYVKDKPEDLIARFTFAKALYRVKQYDDSERILSELIKADIERSEIYFKLAEVQLAKRKFSEAAENFSRAAQIKEAYDEPNPAIYFLLGLANFYNDNTSEARYNFEKFLEYDNIEPTHEAKAKKFLGREEETELAYSSGKVRVIYKKVNLREGPTTKSKKIGAVKKGEIYTVLKEQEGWLHIYDETRARDGWIIRESDGNRHVEGFDASFKESPVSPTYSLSAPLKGFDDTPNANLADFQGKVVLLHFWATWCKPCLKELPSLLEFYHKKYPKLKKKGLELLTISNDARQKDLMKYVSEKNINFPIYWDSLGKINQLVGVGQFIPQTAIIGRNGKVLERLPSQDWKSKSLSKKLKSYLDKS